MSYEAIMFVVISAMIQGFCVGFLIGHYKGCKCGCLSKKETKRNE